VLVEDVQGWQGLKAVLAVFVVVTFQKGLGHCAGGAHATMTRITAKNGSLTQLPTNISKARSCKSTESAGSLFVRHSDVFE
jgi:hypothetical protein